MEFENDFRSFIDRLELQKERILTIPHRGVHDADFYTMILRRIYRRFGLLGARNKEIARILDKDKVYFNKIRIRDDFDKPEKVSKERTIEIKKLPKGFIHGEGQVSMFTSVLIKDDNAFIVSGEFIWNLNEDHKKLLSIVDKVINIGQ